ncbi:MAG: ABC transporter substrate-binding protein [Nitrospirae bacterium]|nr:ABC transporter substrate-binding protein [Nitrospirota bacterium]
MESKGGLDTPYTRRGFLKKAGRLAVAASLTGTALANSESLFASVSVARKISIGIFAPSHCAASFLYTRLKGIFDETKMDVTLINYEGQHSIAKDLIRGKLDFGQMITPLVFAVHTGSNPFTEKTPLALTAIGGTNGSALMVRKDSGIKDPSDFKGKTLANHSKLSVNYLINMMFLEMQGLDYEKDVRFKTLPMDKIIDSMRMKEIDSFVLPEPKNAIAEQYGIGEVFMLSKYIWPNHPCCGLVTRRRFFEDNMELAADVTRCFIRGGLIANDAANREEMVDLLRSVPDYMYDRVPRTVLLNAFTPGRSDFYPFPFQSSARVVIEMMKKYSLLPATSDEKKLAREVFLSDLSRKIMKELGVDPPESNYRTEKILGRLRVYSD